MIKLRLWEHAFPPSVHCRPTHLSRKTVFDKGGGRRGATFSKKGLVVSANAECEKSLHIRMIDDADCAKNATRQARRLKNVASGVARGSYTGFIEKLGKRF